jgi:uncharacterized protein YhaN
MRFSTLELLAFGPFSGETLRFADGTGAINFVYGDNEAGKSTSLRAIGSFLFGIPVRTTDDFVHQKPALKIGANVIAAEGQSLSLVRRKGAKATLRDSAENVVDEDVLTRMLGGLDRELFEQMFALSRDGLVSGGNDLLTGRGSLGEALFGASLGLAGINAVLHTLEEEAAAVFKPGGSVPILNASLRHLEELRRTVRALELRPADFLSHETALDRARSARDALDADLRRAQAELRRLERNKQLLPLAARREELRAESVRLGEVVVLAATAREERLAALRDRDRAVADAESAQDRIDRLTSHLEQLRPNESLLARAEEIAELHQDIGAIRKAARDLPALRSQRRATRDEAAALLAQTHPERSIEDVDDLRLTVALRTSITTLGEDFVRVDEARRSVDTRLAETRARLTRARSAQAALPASQDVSELVAALGAARRLGDIESTIAETEAEHQAADAQLRADLASIPLFQGSIEELERLAVPALLTLARLEAAYEQLDDRQRDLESAHSRTAAAAAAARERLKALELTGVVPSETNLLAARAHRDFGWGIVRRTIEEDETVDVGEFARGQSLTDAFETSMTAADDVADRLRREADRVAARAELEAALARHDKEGVDLQTQLRAVASERAQFDDEWASVWRPALISPLPPAEMRAWLESRTELISAAQRQRETRIQLDGRIALATQHRDALLRELKVVGRAFHGSRTLAELIALAEGTIEENRQKAGAAAKAADAVTALEHDEQDCLLVAERAAADSSSWSTRWAIEVAKLGVEPGLKPDQVRAIVDALIELFIKLDRAAGFQSRIEAIERDALEFATAAANLTDAVAPDIEAVAPEQAVLELSRLLNVSQTEAAKAGEFERQIREATDALQQARDAHSTADTELRRLMKAAMCTSVDALELAEEESAKALSLRERLSAVEEQMTQIGAAPVATLAEEVHGLQLEALEADVQELARAVEELGEQRRELDETVGQERTLLAEMSRGEGAAEAATAVETTKATVREQAELYARLRLAIAILRREIEKFREESHGPLLARASYFFAKLTCDRYVGFTTGFDDHGRVILLGRRKSGAEITVEQMSEGTRDQLYLALRLATIEQHVERSGPLPLIADDLFVNFDDQRAAAGFAALAEMAQNTQVIFFTHHRHLVNLAQATLEPDQWVVQELAVSSAGRFIQAA